MKRNSGAAFAAAARPFFIAAFFGLLAFFAVAPIAIADVPAQFRNGLSDAGYDVYSGDYNGDGYPDLLLRAKHQFVLIDYDTVIPVLLRWRQSFMVLSNSDGSYSILLNPNTAAMSNPLWVPGTHDLIFGDTDGDGSLELLLRSKTPNGVNVLVGTSPTDGVPRLLQRLNAADVGIDMGQADLDVDLLDTNGNGRDDLLIATRYGLVVQISPASSAGTFAPPPADSGSGPTAGTAVGSTAGSFEVSPTGAAMYSIPIVVPPGLGGVEPKLSINFNGESGDGLMGPRFSVSGLSVVARCPSNPSQDGAYKPVKYNSADKFCMDGARLVPDPANAGRFRTELDSFSDVQKIGGSADDPGYWRVRTKAGLSMEFGGAVTSCQSTSKILHPGFSNRTGTWLVSKVSDTTGNWMEFCYDFDANTGESWPRVINYTGNAAGVSPFASVKFVPKARIGLAQTAYNYGWKTSRTRVIDRIETSFEGRRIRAYKFSYAAYGTARRDTLTAVQECGGEPAYEDCLPATRFEWDASVETFAPLSTFSAAATDTEFQHFTGDWDGDGKADVLSAKMQSSGQLRASVLRSTSWNAVASFDAGPNFGIAPTNSNLSGANLASGDFNGDGLIDLAAVKVSGSTEYVASYLSTGNTASAPFGAGTVVSKGGTPYSKSSFQLFAGNVNGDSRDDLLLVTVNGTSGFFAQAVIAGNNGLFSIGTTALPAAGTLDSPDYKPLAGDLSADGLIDLMLYRKTSSSVIVRTYIGSGTGTFTFKTATTLPVPADYVQLADFNGDGNSDLILYQLSDTYCTDLATGVYCTSADGKVNTALGSGLGGFASVVTYTTPGSAFNGTANIGMVAASDAAPPVLGDFNADGILDIAMQAEGEPPLLQLLYGRPDGTLAPFFYGYPTTTTDTGRQLLSGDFDGDGKTDLSLYLTNASTRRMELLAAQRGMPSWLGSITGGLGSRIELDYTPLTDPMVYSRYANGAVSCGGAPSRVLCGPVNVVSASRMSAGSAMREVRYNYDTAYVDVGGRGFQGFREVLIKDQVTGITERTKYFWTWPFAGMAESKTILTPGGTPVSNTLMEYESRTVIDSASGPDVVSVGLRYATTQSWEVGAFPTTNAYSTTVEMVHYGELNVAPFFQNVQQTARYVCAGQKTRAECEASPDFATLTSNQYYPDNTSSWILGRLSRTTVTRSGAGLGSMERTSSYNYDGTTGLLSAEAIEPDDPDGYPYYRQSTSQRRDPFGNIDLESVSAETPSGWQTRSAATTYDAGSPHYRRFKTSLCNAIGQCSSAGYDGSTGQVISTTDSNNLTKRYAYDSFGRQELEMFEEPSTGITQVSAKTRRWCRGDCEPGAVFALESTDNAGGFSAIQYDADEREVARLARAADGTIYKTTTSYDTAGRVYRKSLPFVGSTPSAYIQYAYDVLGRPTTETNPAGAIRRTEYKGLTTVSYDELSRKTTRVNNLLGQVAKVTDHLGGSIDYGYDAFDQLTSTLDAGTDGVNNRAITTIAYDTRGRKISQVDPSSGTWSYRYDGFGQLYQQTDAKNQTVTMSYDALGRMVLRREPEFITQWRYDNDGNGQAWAGALFWVEQRIDGNGNGVFENSDSFVYNRIYAYNSAGGIKAQTESIAGQGAYTYTSAYDELGRLSRYTYPSGFRIQNHYNANGALFKVTRVNSDGGEGTAYWQAQSWDMWGKPSQVSYGNGVVTNSIRDSLLGRLTDISTGPNSNSIQAVHYDWNSAGSLTGRSDRRPELNGQNLNEYFEYDGLGRLKKTLLEIPGVQAKTAMQAVNYLSNGNISGKSGTDGIGAVTYDSAHPQWLATSANGNRAYLHDGNGNLTRYTSNGNPLAAYTWASYNLPTQLVRSGKTATFTYGPDRQKLTQSILSSGKTIVYAGGLYEEYVSANAREKKHYIPTPEGVVAIYSDTGTSNKTEYLHRDHLGSIEVVTSANGQVLQRMSYDAFGKRRAADWKTALNPTPTNFLSAKGFTGHEMLDEVGLIHMNGRVYDPQIGRFISADPTLSNPLSTQGYNRYAYTENQYLNAIDPSGYSFLSKAAGWVKKNWRTLAAVAITVTTGGLAAGMTFWAGLGTVAAGGFAAGMVTSGGDLRAGLIGAATAMAFYGVGSAAQNLSKSGVLSAQTLQVAKVVAHGMVGGVSSAAQGGNFARGFLSAGVSAALAGDIEKFAHGSNAVGVVASAIVGGTVSEIGGGKFANGAVTAAFAYSFAKVAAGAPQSQSISEDANTLIELRHNRIIPWLGPFSPTHAYILVTDLANGTQVAFRAGPTLNLLRDGTFGSINAQGPYDYVPNSPDYTTSPASSSIILQTTAPASGYISQLAAYTSQINAASIPYSILSSNSNSFAYQGIESLGLPRPSTQGFAPAAQSVLGY